MSSHEPSTHEWSERKLGPLVDRLRNAWIFFLDLIVPPTCLGCQAPLATPDSVCPACWRSINFIRQPLCDRLGKPLGFAPTGETVSAEALRNPPDFDRARAAAEHQGTARQLVLALKYHDRHETRRLLGRWMELAGRELIADCDLIIPVPLHRLRFLQRRFNQSALLANEIARHSEKSVRYGALIRRKRTRQQTRLTLRQRQDNLRGAFAVPERYRRMIHGQRILLIDDVLTSGATVNACARVLRRAGATSVDVLTVTRRTGNADIDPVMGDPDFGW
ncbi:MAG: ComF family protein [Pseudomonadota bacterium]